MKRIMNILLIVLGVGALLFLVLQGINKRSLKNIETYPYEVLKEFDSFEIRQYEASLFTSVTMNTSKYEEASSRGFSKLAGYIFGKNQTNEKIAMTSPVAMTLEDSMTMMFMVPKKYKKEDLPEPKEGGISFEEVPAKKMAAIRFGGWANTEKIDRYKQQLKSALAKEGISHDNNFFYLGYNPPYDMINRRNEIVVEVLE
jgi:hypothetical protein